MTTNGSLGYKNLKEKIAGIALDGAGKSGADLEQAGLLNLAGTTVGEGKDGPRLIEMASTSAVEVEATD